MVGIISARLSWLSIKAIKRSNPKKKSDDSEYKMQLMKEQFDGISDDMKEFFHMLKQKSFWKIFRECVRV